MRRDYTDIIFDKMTQKEHDRLCLDEKYKLLLDKESERIGQQRVEEAMDADDWMFLEEFGECLKTEILSVFRKQET